MNQIPIDIFYELCQHLDHRDILALITTCNIFCSWRPLVEKFIIKSKKDEIILDWIFEQTKVRYKTTKEVQYLVLDDISNIPSEIGQLTSLRKLEICGNGISELPPEIGQLTSLQKLYIMNNNNISELPKEIGNLTSLRVLLVGHTQLSELPKEIGRLTALQDLCVSRNKLSNLPREITQLTSLRILTVDGNNLSSKNYKLALFFRELKNCRIFVREKIYVFNLEFYLQEN